MRRVGFFGPFGTFAEQALRTQADLAAAEVVAYPTVPDVLDAVAGGEVDRGVVPIENSIEGVVNFSQDALVFDYDLLITREIVLDIELCLVGPTGARARRREGRALDPGRHRPVPPLPPPAAARCRGAGSQQHRRSGAARRRGRGSRERRRSRHTSPPIAMGSRCSPVTSPTTLGTRRASSSLPAMASRPAPAMTGRRWSCTSGPTNRAA